MNVTRLPQSFRRTAILEAAALIILTGLVIAFSIASFPTLRSIFEALALICFRVAIPRLTAPSKPGLFVEQAVVG